MKLYSESQRPMAVAMLDKARKKSDAKRKTEALAAARENIAAQPSAPLSEEAMALIHDECLSRTPDASDVATIKELSSQGWTPVGIGLALELYPRVVAANL